ncbi:MAG: hypothetical protein MJZ55_00210 [Paludibacteraceae bacterium]|nr:hypothetical protein [Paludibacteraceae bacterium]
MQKYGFYDFKPGDDETYQYDANEFSTIIGAISGNGVNYKYGGKLACTASGLTVNVASGGVWVNGRYGYNDSATTLTLTPATTSGRTDYICAHNDINGRKVEIIQVDSDTVLDENYCVLYEAAITGSSVTLRDRRVYNYGSANEPAAFIIYSANAPAVIEGGIWLKPVEG